MSDRAEIDAALASVVDDVKGGNVCCPGCYPIADGAYSGATYTEQAVERAFAEEPEGKPVSQRPASWGGYDEDETAEFPEPSFPDAQFLVGKLHINYGVRDDDEAKMTDVRVGIVKALQERGFVVEDPGSNDKTIVIEGVTSTRMFA